MRKITRTAALVAALIWMSVPATAATPGEFYGSLLRRGVAAYDAERYDEATRHLRLAAFGFIENIDQYQTAHAYLAATYDRLGQPDRARDSVRRIAQAQRIQPRFAALALPASVRTTVEKHAAAVLTPAEVGGLRGTAAMPPAVPQPPRTTTIITNPATATPATRTPATTTPSTTATTTTTTTTNPPVTVDRVIVEEVKQPANTQTHTGTNNNPPETSTPTTSTPTTTRPATTTPATRTPATTTPATTTPATTTPATTTPATRPAQPVTTQPTPTQPRVQPPAPATTTTTATATPTRPVTYTAAERATRFAAAERALTTNNLAEARRIYTELLGSQGLDRDSYIRLAEGFYRARHFSGALMAFERAGGLRRGEEPYRYYIAVALYETGQYARAKTELAAALPYIEVTPDVARYRTKIQSAVQ